MRILFLDDDDKRQSLFKETFESYDGKSHEITSAKTAQEAIKALEDNPRYDFVSLDHDLTGKFNEPSGLGTGYEVAEFITKMKTDERPTFVVVHSYNHIGSGNMTTTLRRGGVPTEYKAFFYIDYLSFCRSKLDR